MVPCVDLHDCSRRVVEKLNLEISVDWVLNSRRYAAVMRRLYANDKEMHKFCAHVRLFWDFDSNEVNSENISYMWIYDNKV